MDNCFKPVFIDDRLPSRDDRPLYVSALDGMAFPMLLEKGLSKAMGSY